MISIVHTLPDYTTKYKTATIFGQIDTGELAARLGSINTYDRRGNVVLMDDFEATLLKWEAFTIGAGGAIALSSTRARNGDQAVKMTAGSGVNNYALLYRYWPIPVSTKIGFEASFTTHIDIDRILLDIGIYDGITFHHVTVGLSITNDRIYIIQGGGGTVFLSPVLNLYNYDYCFHTLKLVFDLATGHHTRVLFDEQTFDSSAYTIETAASGAAHRMFFGVWSINSKVGNPDIYVDDVIITQNEP